MSALGHSSLREGWLSKETLRTGAYSKRYVWLTAHTIEYAKSEKAAPNKRTVLALQSVSLEPRVVRTNRKTHALTLTVSAGAALAAAATTTSIGGGGDGDGEDEADGGRTYVFASADAAEMRRWHHSIQMEIMNSSQQRWRKAVSVWLV